MKKLIFLLSFTISSLTVVAQISFTSHPILEFYSSGAISVATGDMDGDGDLDIIGSTANAFVWYENMGTEIFPVHIIDRSMETASKAEGVDVIDIDKDGDNDVLGIGTSSGTFQWYENDGKGNFTTHIIDSKANFPDSAVGTDLDLDGDIDIIGSIYWEYLFVWYENDGKQNFTRRQIYQANCEAYDITAGDLDNDGDVDLILVYGSSLGWLENDGKQNFQYFQNISYDTFFNINGLNSITDIDQDGDKDILVASNTSNSFVWIENKGKGGFVKHIINESPLYSAKARAVSSADMDKDGDIDIIGAALEKLTWFENDGNQNFTPHRLINNTSFSLIDGGYDVLASDIDQNGHLDIVVAANYSNAFSIWKNDGSQNFSPIRLGGDSFYADGAWGVDSGDLDNDGDMDIAAISVGVMNGFSWLENNGKGQFSPHLIDKSDFNAKNPREVKVVDINGDSNLDIIGSSYWTGAFSWFENDGKGNFSTHTIDRSSDSEGSYDIDYADLDKDGDIDVVGAALIGDKFLWFENDGKGNFTRHIISSSLELSDGAFSVCPIDMDKDGDIDVLGSSRYPSMAFSWFENDGDGNFTGHLIDKIETEAIDLPDIVGGDLNNDGYMDVVGATSTKGDAFNWYENDGANNFTRHIVPGIECRKILIFDLNKDGYNDVIGSSSNGTFFENDGSGKFTLKALDIKGVKYNFGRFALTDLDKNGDIDLIGVSSNKYFWYESSGITETGAYPSMKQNKKNIVKFYPNPSEGVIHIESDRQINKIEIFNSVGQKVLSKITNDYQDVLTISNPGLYVVRAHFDKEVYIEKIIIK